MKSVCNIKGHTASRSLGSETIEPALNSATAAHHHAANDTPAAGRRPRPRRHLQNYIFKASTFISIACLHPVNRLVAIHTLTKTIQKLNTSVNANIIVNSRHVTKLKKRYRKVNSGCKGQATIYCYLHPKI